MSEAQHIVSIIANLTKASVALAFAVMMYRWWRVGRSNAGVKTEPEAEKIIFAELDRQHSLHKLEIEVLQNTSCLGRVIQSADSVEEQWKRANANIQTKIKTSIL